MMDRKYKRYFVPAPSGVHPGIALRVTSGLAGACSAAKARMGRSNGGGQPPASDDAGSDLACAASAQGAPGHRESPCLALAVRLVSTSGSLCSLWWRFQRGTRFLVDAAVDAA
jgi:hypothetical protein